uniref:alkaline phosphatase n=1 Tax=Parastrongyloides trichosuri TaxID=131310 RepID=A0A0N4ZQB4_PARTI
MLIRNIFTTILLILFVSVSISQLNEEYESFFWNRLSKDYLNKKIDYLKSLGVSLNKKKKPKNVILFIGDGMGTTITTVSRIFKNQQESKNLNKDIFDQTPLKFEMFENTGLVRTHSLNLHVGTSAAGAVAMISGQKSTSGVINIKPGGNKSDCNVNENEKQLNSLVFEALRNNVKVGFITTTRISHATPASMYAFTKNRFHENDNYYKNDSYKKNCKDIAQQIINYPANQFSIMLGGGRMYLMPEEENDPVYTNVTGKRTDKKNILNEWKKLYPDNKLLLTKDDLLKKDYNVNTKHILGVFSPSHLKYYIDKDDYDKKVQPTLEEMTEYAIEFLEKDNTNGYFLMIEGGLIDIAAHENRGYVTLSETIEFDKAIDKANKMTKINNDTLIIVTADHSHPLNFNGFPSRDTNVLGTNFPLISSITVPQDKKNIPNLLFTAGKGFNSMFITNKITNEYTRKNLTDDVTIDPNFITPSCILAEYGSHGGEDVSLFSTGPLSYLFSGNYDNTQIAYNIKYALCINTENELNICDETFMENYENSMSNTLNTYKTLLIYSLCICLLLILMIIFISLSYFRLRDLNLRNNM